MAKLGDTFVQLTEEINELSAKVNNITDTKNTAGATNSSSKLFLIGATSQGDNPQTYSQDTAYVGTDGHLYSNSSQVVNLATTQTITGAKTITGVFKILNGSAAGSFVLGANVNSTGLTANTRKLGRMGVPAYTSNGSSVNSTVAGISFDAQANANYADFGGHPNNTSSIAPDVIRFIVANEHNNSISGARTLALQISKQDGLVDTSGGGTSVAGAKFFVPVQATSTVTASGGFVGNLTGKASDSDKLDGNDSAYYLDYDNFTNTPTIPSTASEVGADPSGSANTALIDAKSYTDTKIANLINGAPDTLDTLSEIATAMSENAGVVTALQSAIGDKANKTDIPTDYISTGSTTQCRVGGLVLGQSSVPSGVNPSAGRVYVIGSNPLFGLKSTSGSTQFFLQVNGDNLYLGPTSANALQFTSTGATSVPKTFEAKGLLTATGGLKTNKIQVPTTSGGSTYGVGSNGQVLTSNGSTSYWSSLSASSVGLDDVENKSSETIRSEITKSNVTTALGYTPPMQDTTYSEVTTSASGLMSASDKTKLDGIATGANKYTHPTHTSKTSGFYKITVDSQGHVSAATAVEKTDITDLGIPAQDTTYDEATTTTSGLMSATDKTKIGVTNVAYGTCTTAAGTAAKVVTISGNDNWELTTGSLIVVKFSYTNTASNPTLNVNGTGAKSVVYGTSTITTSNPSYAGYKDRYIEYMYNGTAYVFIGWSYDTNSTYSNASLGQGYGTCSTAETTLAKVVSLSSYALTTGGVIAVKFTNAVPANSTMNINSKGAKAIYYKGSAITDGIIKAGDVATFIYSTNYHLISIDRNFDIDTSNFVTLTDAQDITGTKNFSAVGFNHTYGGLFGTLRAATSADKGVQCDNILLATKFAPTQSIDDANITSSSNGTYGKTAYCDKGISVYGNNGSFNKLLLPLDGEGTLATQEWVTANASGGGSVDTTNFKVDKLTFTYRDTEQGYIAPQTSYGGLQFSTKTFAPSLIPTKSIDDSASQVSPYSTQLVQGGVILNTSYSSENTDGVTKLKYPTDRLDDQTFATREWVQAQGYGSGGGGSDIKSFTITGSDITSSSGTYSLTSDCLARLIEFNSTINGPVRFKWGTMYFTGMYEISSWVGFQGYRIFSCNSSGAIQTTSIKTQPNASDNGAISGYVTFITSLIYGGYTLTIEVLS